jgi:hypothetical protein
MPNQSIRRLPILFIVVLTVLALLQAPLAAQSELPERFRVAMGSYTQILPELEAAKRTMEELGGEIDVAVQDDVELDCWAYFDLYQDIAALPEFDTSDADELTQYAAEQYEEAVTYVLDTSHSLYLECDRVIEAAPAAARIPSRQWGLTWGLSRMGIAESVDMLDKAIQRLREELPDTTDYSRPGGQVLKASKDAIRHMNILGWQIDRREIVAREFVEAYEQLNELPEFDTSALDPVVQDTYTRYRWAVDNVLDTSRDLYLSQRSTAAQPGERRLVLSLQTRLSRKGIADAVNVLDQVVKQLSE